MELYRNKIEQQAGTMEKLGLSPVGARIYIYLFYSPEQEASFDEMLQYFNVSKSAVSNALKYLIAVNMITAKTKHGKRKRYFSLDLETMISTSLAISKFEMMKQMLTDIDISRKANDAFAKKIKDAAGFFKMMIDEYPSLLAKWELKKSNK